MSVYTAVEADDLVRLLSHYDIGELEAFRGIAAGITNTNYFVDTTTGRWVLTLFEHIDDSEPLVFFMRLMDHLAARGIPGAHPVARRDGNFLSLVRGRPAALVYRLAGASIETPGPSHCASLGQVVASMHKAAADFASARAHPNPRSLDWIIEARARLASVLASPALELLDDEIAAQRAANAAVYANLTRAVVHADLFRDNVLFEDDRVSGIIDFYYACHEYLLFDLAVACNDWAFDDEQNYRADCWQAFVDGYRTLRPITSDDRRAWPMMLRAAALRFWVSRLVDYHFPMSGQVTHVHDPRPFERLLRRHRAAAPALTRA